MAESTTNLVLEENAQKWKGHNSRSARKSAEKQEVQRLRKREEFAGVCEKQTNNFMQKYPKCILT